MREMFWGGRSISKSEVRTWKVDSKSGTGLRKLEQSLGVRNCGFDERDASLGGKCVSTFSCRGNQSLHQTPSRTLYPDRRIPIIFSVCLFLFPGNDGDYEPYPS